MFSILVPAKFRAAHRLAITTAWAGESFHRTKTLKQLEHYLGEGMPKDPEVEAQSLRSFIAAKFAKQKQETAADGHG